MRSIAPVDSSASKVSISSSSSGDKSATEMIVRDNCNHCETQSKIFDVYFHLLLEYVNKNRKMKVGMSELISSDHRLLINWSPDYYLTSRFRSLCNRSNIDYRAISHVVPIESPFSGTSVTTVINNYRTWVDKTTKRPNTVRPSCLRNVSQCLSTPNSNNNYIVSRRNSETSSIKSQPSTPDLSLLPLKRNYSLPPTMTPDRDLLNDLSSIDCDLLKIAENASERSSIKLNSDETKKDVNVLNQWGTLLYYELNSRVGDAFASSTPIVTIDGFTSPPLHTNRFSLGHLTNVYRSNQTEATRKCIGKGAKLYYINGELFLECLSDNSIFVQSPMSNIVQGWHPATVIKIPPKCNIKVFNEKDFFKTLNQRELEGFEAVFALTPLCSIRISFVKGWGASYSRQKITMTPCWVEVHLHEPLKCLDATLRRLEAPSNICSSRS